MSSSNPGLKSLNAVVFDVFGTVVDWRTSIIEEGERYWKPRGVNIDWARFADAWRAKYVPGLNAVRSGELPWMKLDALHRRSLDQLLPEFGLTHLNEADKDHLNRVWHRLQPWPDALEGLRRMKTRYILAPLSNGNVSLMVHLARHAGFHWDCILGAEPARHYKPDREIYQSAVDYLDMPAGEIMLVAAHHYDLHAARAIGLKTGFVPRPAEYGPNSGKSDLKGDPAFDVNAKDFLELAEQLQT
jgi:2-haloacid dehalogenase